MTDPKNLHLVFDGKTLDYVVNLLAQRPYAEVAALLADISQQIAAQQKESPLTGAQLVEGAQA